MSGGEAALREERAAAIEEKISKCTLRSKCFLISRRWWSHFTAYLGWTTPDNDFGNKKLTPAGGFAEPGPIDNMDLV